MKKIRLNIAIIATIFAAIFSSCDKDVESTAVKLDLHDSAAITLYIYADLDKTDAGQEAAPANTQVYVKINYSDYKAGADGAWSSILTTDASGMIMLKVPADANGVNVQITPMPFEFSQVQTFNNYESTVSKIFTANQVTVNVSAGEAKVQQINYKAPETFNDFTEITKITGTVMAAISDKDFDSDTITSAVTITFHTSDWSTEVPTDGSGNFEVEVPKGENIYVTGIFQADNIVGTSRDLYEYELIQSYIGNFATETKSVVVDFGTGIEVQ